MSKWFELVLLEVCDEYLNFNNRQFGFKKHLGCDSAMFAVFEDLTLITVIDCCLQRICFTSHLICDVYKCLYYYYCYLLLCMYWQVFVITAWLPAINFHILWLHLFWNSKLLIILYTVFITINHSCQIIICCILVHNIMTIYSLTALLPHWIVKACISLSEKRVLKLVCFKLFSKLFKVSFVMKRGR